jgi:hypothetical protein
MLPPPPPPPPPPPEEDKLEDGEGEGLEMRASPCPILRSQSFVALHCSSRLGAMPALMSSGRLLPTRSGSSSPLDDSWGRDLVLGELPKARSEEGVAASFRAATPHPPLQRDRRCVSMTNIGVRGGTVMEMEAQGARRISHHYDFSPRWMMSHGLSSRMSMRTIVTTVLPPADPKEALRRRLIVVLVWTATMASLVPLEFISPFFPLYSKKELGFASWETALVFSAFSVGQVGTGEAEQAPLALGGMRGGDILRSNE